MLKKHYEKVPPSVENPYRASSKKARAFELFREGGERRAVIAKLEALGITNSSARRWINLFRKRR